MLTVLILISLKKCDGLPTFYIYEWPDNITDVYPDENITLSNGPRGHGFNSIYKHNFKWNHGFGELFSSEIGIFNSFQFALFKQIYYILQKHPQRTFNKEEASAFFVPYDVGFNGMICKETGRETSRVWLGCDKSPYALSLLKKEFEIQQSFSREFLWGNDHFLIFDLSNAHYLNEQCFNFLSYCGNCSVFGIESLLYPTPYYNYMNETNNKISWRWQGIPFPGNIHWNERIDKNKLPWTVGRWNKSTLSCFIGSSAVYNKRSVKIRKEILRHCSLAGPEDCRPNGEIVDRIKFFLTGDSLLVYANSTFCFQPPGDAETRKGFFDALLVGCIPVVFTPDAFSRVYGWHVTPEEGRNISVYIPFDIWTRRDNIIDILKAIPKEEVLAKQRAIEQIAPRLQYSYPPESAKVWTPPFKDALQVLLDKLFDRIDNFKRTKIVPLEDRPNVRSFFDAIY